MGMTASFILASWCSSKLGTLWLTQFNFKLYGFSVVLGSFMIAHEYFIYKFYLYSSEALIVFSTENHTSIIFLYVLLFRVLPRKTLIRSLFTKGFDQRNCFAAPNKKKERRKTKNQQKNYSRHFCSTDLFRIVIKFIQQNQTRKGKTPKPRTVIFILHKHFCRHSPSFKNADEQITSRGGHAIVERSNSYHRFGALWWVLSLRI